MRGAPKFGWSVSRSSDHPLPFFVSYRPLACPVRNHFGDLVYGAFVFYEKFLKMFQVTKKNVTVLALGYSPRTGLGPSTIAASELNCRVRDGNGCDLAA
jgi:hypothetical protein